MLCQNTKKNIPKKVCFNIKWLSDLYTEVIWLKTSKFHYLKFWVARMEHNVLLF